MIRIADAVTIAFVLGSCSGTHSSNDGSGNITDGGGSVADGSENTPDAGKGATDYEWANWPVPPDSPIDYGCSDDTCTDNVTGLVWQRIAPSPWYSWDNAKAYCQGLSLGGFSSGWRLPTAIELVSIVDVTVDEPAINQTAFPSTQTGFFWSSSPFVSMLLDDDAAWGVDFTYGLAGDGDVGVGGRVRCVHSVGPAIATDAAGAPAGQYTISPETVRDNRTGLVWQRCIAGRSGATCTDGTTLAKNWTAAATYCVHLDLGGYTSGWRLPTYKELQSIVDRRTSGPAVDRTAFPSTPSDFFWSSSPLAYDEGAWGVDFENGCAWGGNVDYSTSLRCVR